MLWCFVRQFVRAPSGRQRFNVLGALNAITHELVLVTNDTYINALSVCDLLRRIAALELTVPITLVLDNPRYQKCHLVRDLAATLNIELLYLPTYSPNLNLIERLWKFVKKKCLYSTSRETNLPAAAAGWVRRQAGYDFSSYDDALVASSLAHQAASASG